MEDVAEESVMQVDQVEKRTPQSPVELLNEGAEQDSDAETSARDGAKAKNNGRAGHRKKKGRSAGSVDKEPEPTARSQPTSAEVRQMSNFVVPTSNAAPKAVSSAVEILSGVLRSGHRGQATGPSVVFPPRVSQ